MKNKMLIKTNENGMNKKGVIGSTLVLMFVIIFIVIVLVLFSFFFLTIKGRENLNLEERDLELEASSELINYLNTPVDVNIFGEKVSNVFELITITELPAYSEKEFIPSLNQKLKDETEKSISKAYGKCYYIKIVGSSGTREFGSTPTEGKLKQATINLPNNLRVDFINNYATCLVSDSEENCKKICEIK